MSIYWRKQPSQPDTDLPQTIMRPFWHPIEIALDDKKFCLELVEDKPRVMSLFVLVISLTLFFRNFKHLKLISHVKSENHKFFDKLLHYFCNSMSSFICFY